MTVICFRAGLFSLDGEAVLIVDHGEDEQLIELSNFLRASKVTTGNHHGPLVVDEILVLMLLRAHIPETGFAPKGACHWPKIRGGIQLNGKYINNGQIG